MLAIARRIASGRDTGSVPIAALLQTKLSADQLKLLQSEVAGTSLQAGNHTNVIAALNALLRDAKFSSRDNVDGVKAQLNRPIQALQAKRTALQPRPKPCTGHCAAAAGQRRLGGFHHRSRQGQRATAAESTHR